MDLSALQTHKPVAVAVRGASASLAQEGTALAAGWLSFIAARALGVRYLPAAVAIM